MKRIGLYIVFFLISLMISCGNKELQEAPADLIPRNEMIDIVVDTWLLESTIHTMVKQQEQFEPASVTLYAEFFKEHHISKEQYINSLEFYIGEQKASEIFIRECIRRLEERQEELTGVAAPVSQPQ